MSKLFSPESESVDILATPTQTPAKSADTDLPQLYLFQSVSSVKRISAYGSTCGFPDYPTISQCVFFCVTVSFHLLTENFECRRSLPCSSIHCRH